MASQEKLSGLYGVNVMLGESLCIEYIDTHHDGIQANEAHIDIFIIYIITFNVSNYVINTSSNT